MTETESETPVHRVSRRELMASGMTLGATAMASQYGVGDVLAQSGGPSTEISGIVEDGSGGVDGATVVAVPHDETLSPLVTTTASDGTYSFQDSDLHEGENLYHVIARDGTETDPRRGQENYPFIAAEGPSAIPDSVVLQYDISQETGYSDGDTISTLTDFEGGADATGSATYRTNEQNGEPTASFDAVDDYFTNSGFSLSQPLVVAAVAKHTNTGDSEFIVDGDSGRVILGNDGGGNGYGLYAGSWVRSGTGPTSYSIVCGLVDGANSEFRINGSTVTSGDAGSNGYNGISVGGDYGGGSLLDGNIGELVVGNDVTNLGDIESYLADKWGITL